MWTELETGNDWEHVYLAPKGQARDEHGMADHKRGLAFKDGEPVRIRFPDGHTSTQVIAMRDFTKDYGDMGHTYTASYSLAGVVLAVHGVHTWVPLHEAGEVWIEKDT